MGQTVEIRGVDELGDLLLVDTDRSLTGQDGHELTPRDPGEAVPGQLARKLFDLGLGIDHVYVLQNIVSIRRPSGWDQGSRSVVEETVSHFLRFYPGDDVEGGGEGVSGDEGPAEPEQEDAEV